MAYSGGTSLVFFDKEVLVVGDGDLSFSASLCTRVLDTKCLTATVYDKEDEFGQKYGDKLGVQVGKRMKTCCGFFPPWSEEEEEERARKVNRKIRRHFFISSILKLYSKTLPSRWAWRMPSR